MLKLSMSSTAALLSRSLTAEKRYPLWFHSTLSETNLNLFILLCSIITHDQVVNHIRYAVQLEKGTPGIADIAGNITLLFNHPFPSISHLPIILLYWFGLILLMSLLLQLFLLPLLLLSLSLFRQNKRRDERLRVLLPSFLGHSRPPILFLALYFHQRVGRTLHFLRSEVPCSRKEKKAIVTGNAWYREEHPQEEIDEWPHTLPRHLPFTILPCLFYFMVLVNKYVYVPWMFQLSSLL